MFHKKLWFITIFVLLLSFLSINAFAQETQGDPFEIWPGDIDPPDGSVDIYVPEGQNIVIRTSFAACARPLSKNWTKFDRITLSMDGNSMVSSAKESKSYWSSPYAIPNEGVPCVNDSDKLWVVDWAYDLGARPIGTYPVHFTENVRGLFTDGADYDGDGIPDFFSWHVNVDFNIVVIEMGSIAGQVTNQETGDPIEGILVAACEVDVYCDSVRTDANGNYEIFLPPATYRVGAHHETDYVSEYFEEKMNWDEADNVIVNAGEETPNINFTLIPAGTISGTVTEQDSGIPGIPIVDMEVAACPYDFDTGEYVEDMPCYSGWTETDGSYFIRGVPAGTYIVDSGWSGNWVPEIYSEQVDYSLADPVTVVANENTPDIDFTLELGGSISGWVIVQDTSNEPVVDMEVAACPYDFDTGEYVEDMPCYSGWTETDGSYFIRGVPAGTYIVDSGWSGNWIPEIYSEQVDYSLADPVTVVADENTPDIDFTLELGGSISGWVTDESGAPIVDWVGTCDESVSDEEWGSSPLCNGAETDENGFYTITGLRPGNYRVVVWGGEMYIHEYYDNTRSYYEATLVPVIAAVTTEDINFTLSTPEPVLSAWPHDDYVEGWEWDEGSLVTLTIDDPSNGPGVDYADTQIVTPAEWNPDDTYVSFNFQDVFDLQAGFSVMMTDTNYAKQHTVTELTIIDVDPDSDIASGTAAPGSHVYVGSCDDIGCAERHEIADPSGNWTADFSVPGDEPGEENTLDIAPGVGVEANQPDEDSDATRVGWWIEEPYIPNPGFLVNLTSNEVHSWEWIAGTTISLTIDAPGTEWTQIYSDTTVAEQKGPEPWETFTWFSFPDELGVGPGYRVTLTDGSTTKEHIVTNLVVLEADADADTVSGMADPYAEVIVDSWLGANRRAMADAAGYWIVDFSVPGIEDWEQDIVDLRPGDGGGINQYDDDGDSTNINWWVPNPRLDAWPDADYVDTWEWTAGVPLTLTIDNPANGPGIDYTDTQIPYYPDWDPNQTQVQFNFQGSFDLQPGFIVTLDNGRKTKQHIVTVLAVTGFDLNADLVWGVASPEADTWIWVCDDTGCATRHAFTNGTGNWTVNFAQPGAEPYEDVIWDLVPGSSGSAAEPDADNDATLIDWWVPE